MATLLDYALTTVADVKETLGIASGDHSKDNLIIRKINQATEIIEGYCDRRFKATDYTNEEYDGSLTDNLLLRNWPVLSFTGLGARDSSLNQGDFDTINAENYFVDLKGGIVDTVVGGFYGSYDRWRVSYRAGYETIPSDLAEACATLAAHLVSSSIGGGGLSNAASMIANRLKEGQREISFASGGSSGSGSGSGGSGGNALFEQLGIQATLDRYAGVSLSGAR